MAFIKGTDIKVVMPQRAKQPPTGKKPAPKKAQYFSNAVHSCVLGKRSVSELTENTALISDIKDYIGKILEGEIFESLDYVNYFSLRNLERHVSRNDETYACRLPETLLKTNEVIDKEVRRKRKRSERKPPSVHVVYNHNGKK